MGVNLAMSWWNDAEGCSLGMNIYETEKFGVRYKLTVIGDGLEITRICQRIIDTGTLKELQLIAAVPVLLCMSND